MPPALPYLLGPGKRAYRTSSSQYRIGGSVYFEHLFYGI